MRNVIYSKFSNERSPEFSIRTDIIEENGIASVTKNAVTPAAEEHIERMLAFYNENSKEYEQNGVKLCPCKSEERGAIGFEFVKGETLSEKIDNLIKNKKYQEVKEIFDRFYAFLKNLSGKKEFKASKKFEDIFGVSKYYEETYVMKNTNIDLIFENLIEQGLQWIVIDYEWTFDIECPLKFIMYRTIFYTEYNSAFLCEIQDLKLYDRYFITEEERELFAEMESSFQSYVVGNVHSIKKYCGNGIDVKKLIVQRLWEHNELGFQIYEDKGNGISEAGSRKVIVELSDEGAFDFNTYVDADCIQMRIDPGDDAIVLRIDEIDFDILNMNGVWLDESHLIFKNSDPWIYIDIKSVNDGKVHLKGVAYKLKDGFIKAADKILENERISREKQYSRVSAEKEFLCREMNNMYKAGILKKSNSYTPAIAIHLHLFYVDLLDEFAEYFNNIPYPFDIYVSCTRGANTGMIKRKLMSISNVHNVEVVVCKNQGRDLAPLYVTFAKKLLKYKYLLHVHSKKSKHIEQGGSEWRIYSLNSLIGSKEKVSEIVGAMESNKQIGLVYPEVHPDIPMIGYTWMGNKYPGKEFMQRLNIKFEDGVYNYPAGSFFWARVDAIKDLLSLGLTLQDFPKEAGQIDGTLAHVLERAIVFVAKKNQYHSMIVDETMEYFQEFKSRKPFKPLLDMTLDEAKEKLNEYKYVSFAVFDTLVEFTALNNKDIIYLVRDAYGFNDDFVAYRKKAEELAGNQYGFATGIKQIYDILSEISPYERAVTDQIMAKEKEILLAHICPREDMKQLYKYLKEQGKKIVVVEDTYYDKATIQAALIKCGYIGFDDMFLSSCEGYSKEDEQIWNLVFAKYPAAEMIHIGSDVYADWYTLERRAANSLWVLSPFEAYKLSDKYDENKDYDNPDINESLSIGESLKVKEFNSVFELNNKMN